MLRKLFCSILLFPLAIFYTYRASPSFSRYHSDSATANEPRALTASEAAQFLPATVFFRGRSAPIQARNSSGVQFNKNELLLVTLVDTAGYSSSVQEKYQAYLITEASLDIEGHRLPPGAYGCGFLAGDTFVVMDIGGHDLFSARSARDATLHRPTPLQVLPAANGAGYRLYVGRDYIDFAHSPETNSTTSLRP